MQQQHPHDDQFIPPNDKQKHMYNVVTGNALFQTIPWQQDQLQPDLILTWKIPEQKYIQKSNFKDIGAFANNPPHYIQKAFYSAQKFIIKQMASFKQNVVNGKEDTTIKIRLQQALQERQSGQLGIKHAKYIHPNSGHQIPFELQCVHQKQKVLDGFTLQYNTVMYTLQQVCGFRVRSFMVYDEELEDKKIFFFLNLSTENRMRLAAKYQMKKQIDYSIVDFFLNQPIGYDYRPLKIHSSQTSYKNILQLFKKISRYFHIVDPHVGKQIIEQNPVDHKTQSKFRMCTEDLSRLLQYYKKVDTMDVDKHEKQYLFQYNNYKINKGCQLLYHNYEQRKQFYDCMEALSHYYGFGGIQPPEMFQQFLIPSKEYAGAGYFQRLKAILLYKPQQISPDGKLDLFLKMEKIKLAFLALKSKFKLHVLADMGFDILALPDDFQLKGKGGTQKVKGGVDGQNVRDSWPVTSLFTKTNVIRNYFGNNVGLQIAFKIYLIVYFVVIVTPYTIVFILEAIFSRVIFFATNQTKGILLAVSFRIYLTIWQEFQKHYQQKFRDDVSSKVFRGQFRGPYVRNPLNDEINQFRDPHVLESFFKNIVITIFLFIIFVVFGAVFYGSRIFLVDIYDPLSWIRIGDISFVHLLGYSPYFAFSYLMDYFLMNKIIDFLVWFKDPASDDDARLMGHEFKFFYLMGLQFIPPLFFMILQPLAGTSCYSKNCINQIVFYAYVRYLVLLIQLIIRSVYLCYMKSKNKLEALLEQKIEGMGFQSNIVRLLTQTVKQSQKPMHINNNNIQFIALISFAIYNILFPLQIFIALFNLLISIFNVRNFLLTHARRTINRSQCLLMHSFHLQIVYYMAIIFSAWTNVFPVHTIQKNFPTAIDDFLPTINTEGIFLLNIVFVVIFAAIMFFIGAIFDYIVSSFSAFWLQKRSRRKFDQYWIKGHTKKLKFAQKPPPLIPKTIFRVHNPKVMNHQKLQQLLQQKSKVEAMMNLATLLMGKQQSLKQSSKQFISRPSNSQHSSNNDHSSPLKQPSQHESSIFGLLLTSNQKLDYRQEEPKE